MLKRYPTLIPILFFAINVFATGCSNRIKLAEETIPTPVVRTLPISMAIYYDENLADSKKKIIETSFGRLGIDLLKAQDTGFEKIFTQIFENTKEVDSLDAIPLAYDGLISIKLSDYEVFEQRKTTNTYVYFTELSYDLDIYDKNNKFTQSINVTGEGEAYDENLVPTRLIKEANINALRDAFSSITLELLEHAELFN